MPIDLTNSLSSIGLNQYRSLQSMGSGKSINSAADNPAGLAESASFSVQISGAAQALSNAQNASSALNTAQGGVNQIASDLQGINTLSVQAGNGILTASDKQAIQTQINQSLQDINQVAQNTQFNGQPLLNGNQSITAQTGPNAGNAQTFSLPNLSGSALNVSNIDITSSAGQSSALSAVQNALNSVNSAGASLGAAQTGLDIAQSSQAISQVNASASNSALSDTNYASASSTLAQSNISQQAAIYAINMYNATQKSVLALLPGNSHA